MCFYPYFLPRFLGVLNINGLGWNPAPTFEWNQGENRKTKGSTQRSCQILKGIWQHLSCRCWIARGIAAIFLGENHRCRFGHQPQVLVHHGFNPQNSLYSISWLNKNVNRKKCKHRKCSAFWDTYIYDLHGLRWKVAVLEYVICPQPRTVSGVFPNAISSTSQNIKSTKILKKIGLSENVGLIFPMK